MTSSVLSMFFSDTRPNFIHMLSLIFPVEWAEAQMSEIILMQADFCLSQGKIGQLNLGLKSGKKHRPSREKIVLHGYDIIPTEN